jgi:hypothetical protein
VGRLPAEARAERAEMKSGLLPGQALFAVLPVVSGGTLPVFGYVNLIWGSLFGLPGVVFHWTRLWHPLWTDLIWTVAWPIVLIFLLGRLARWILLSRPQTRAACLMLYAASFVAIVPVDGILTAPLGERFDYEYLPLYVKLLVY